MLCKSERIKPESIKPDLILKNFQMVGNPERLGRGPNENCAIPLVKKKK